MLDRIKQILIDNKDIDGYKIIETKTESNELFFVKKNVDMDRAKSVHHFKVTVYKDIREDGEEYKGSSSTSIHPTMSDKEIENAINDTIFAAQYVKNYFYPLVKSTSDYKEMESSNFSKEELPYWMNEITKAIYKNDNYEKGGINSCEIFLNKIYTHFINSEGVNVDSLGYDCMVEFITTWKEDGEEVELYKCLNFSDLDTEALSEEIQKMITICKEKAIAKSTPLLGKSSVLLTGDAVKEFFSFYYSKSSAEEVYKKGSTWKIGDEIQGEKAKGDLITMTLNPFMKNSTYSGNFDEDGFPVQPVTILEKGILKRYITNTRYAHYLNVEATGSIKNMIICGGTKSISELKEEEHLEIAAFSDFNMDNQTGDFCGEIRLAWYFDGKKTMPVTGGSISGNINELQNELFLSKELKKDNNFEGPSVVKLFNVKVTGTCKKMTSDDIKKNCAKEALKYIKNNTIIGLGGGSTISYLIDYIKENKELKVKIVTPSSKTKLLCIKNGLEILHTCSVDRVDVAFDGCDEVDESLNALKSGGGIHTNEKLIATMADEYILLVDETKVVKILTFKHPVVLEILEDSLKYVERSVIELGGKGTIRESTAKDGFTISDNGNLLMDVIFNKVKDIHELENSLKDICGVIDTSLFTSVVTKALVASDNGIRVISKKII